MADATWLTKAQAAEAIGVSEKTIEKLAKDGQIESGRWRFQGRGNEFAVYDPSDVARIAAAKRQTPPPFVLPAVRTGHGNGHGAIARTAPDAEAQQAVAAGLSALAAAMQALAPIPANPQHIGQNHQNPQKLFLTVLEAAAVSGLSVAYLKREIGGLRLPAVRDGRSWRIRRKDLEAL